MTSQQFPPAGDPNSYYGGPPPMVQQPSAPFAAAPGGRRTGLIAVGALVLAAGVAAGIVMIMASGTNYDDAVQNLARAPIGCTTSLRFDDTGTFVVYVETQGSIGDVRGDCPNTDTDYHYTGEQLPDVDIALTGEDGNEVELHEDFGKDYDAGGAVGQSIGTIEIDQSGDYDITVTSDADEFAIAIGKNPKADSDSLRTGGFAALVAGVVIGGLMLLLGLRRRKPPVMPVPPPVTPYGVPPAYAPAQPAPPPTAGWPPATPAPPVAPPSAPRPPMGPPSWPAPPSA